MAISYEDWKSQYEWMSTDQQAKYAGMVKGNALAEEYANRYIQEKQDAGTFWQKTARSYTNANTPVNTPTQNTSSVSTPTRNETTPTTTVTPTPTTRQETPTVIGDTRKETTRTETPVTTVSEIKQEWALTPLSKEYYSQTSDDAQTKIINNLNSYKASNPEYFTDYETFKRNFSYNARNDEQKNTLDTWYKWYSQGLQLSWTPIADLYTQYKNWSISTGDLESLRIANPTKYAELQAQINKWNIIAAYDDDNQTTETMFDQLRNSFLQNMITNLNASWSGASSIFDSYKDKMESPEMTELWDDAAAKQEEIEKVSADIDSMKKQVEKEYEGTWASRAKINAIVADRTYDLQLQLRSLNSEYNRIATQYNNRMNQYQSEFQLQLQEYQINMQERNQKMNELGFAMDLMNYETPQQKQEREWNFWLKQQEYKDWNINSKDPTIQLKAIQNSVDSLLQNYQWIPTIRSSTQIAQDIQTAINNWSNLGDELTKLNKQMQSKDEYKLMYKATYNWKQTLGTINWKSAVITYDAAGNYVGYELLNTSPNSINNSNRNSQIKSFSDVWDMSNNSWDSYIANIENAVQLWSRWWQCWAWANDILSGAWADKIFWNSLSDKIKVCDNKYSQYQSNDFSKLKSWDFVVLDTGAKLKDWTAAGHVWVIKSIDLNNWTITVFDTNWQAGKECWWESTYNLSIVRGSYDPRTQANFRQVQATEQPTSERWNAMNYNPWYSEEDIWIYDKYLKGNSPSEKYIESKWGWDVFKSEVRAYQMAKANNTIKADESLYAPYNNPMADAYETALVNASTDSKSNSLNEAFNFYSQAYSMLNDGSLQELASDSDLQEIIKDAYNNRNKNSIKWDVFAYMYNKKLTEGQRMALNQLKRLCEIKLRKESWAAINAEERESAYEFFFPAIWESSEYSMNKILNNVNSTVWQRFLNWGVSRKDFVPLSSDMMAVSSTYTSPTSTNTWNTDFFEEWRNRWGSTYTAWWYTIDWDNP